MRRIVESYSAPNQSISKRIEESLPHIFDFDFPIYDESHRAEIEKKIIMHYFMREIGLETVALWKLYLEERLNLEMPYYNNLYAIEANKYDYLINIDEHISATGEVMSHGETDSDTSDTTTKTGTNDTDTTGEDNREIKDSGEDILSKGIDENTTRTDSSNGSSSVVEEGNVNSNGTIINSDFPQATFNKSVDYASGSQQSQNDTVSTNSTNNTTTATGEVSETRTGTDTDTTTYGKVTNDNLKHNSHSTGRLNESVVGIGNNHGTDSRNTNSLDNTYSVGTRGSKTQLMLEYRESIINIDKMVVNMLSDLFMGVYD